MQMISDGANCFTMVYEIDQVSNGLLVLLELRRTIIPGYQYE